MNRADVKPARAAQRVALAGTTEVAEYLGKAEGTLRNWRYLGVGPKYLKVGGHEVRYRWDEVDRWLTTQVGGTQ